MNIDQWKKNIESKKKNLVAKIEKDKTQLARFEMYLSDPEHYFHRTGKARTKYENKKAKKNPNESLPPKKEEQKTEKRSFLDDI